MNHPRKSNISLVESNGGFILLDKRAGRYWQLNEVGAMIFQSASAGDSLESIADKITAEFDVERSVALRDARDTMRQFRASKILR
jgi:hypothetical protein